MAWDFSTEPDFQEKLAWMERFVRDEVEPVDALWGDHVYERPMRPALSQVASRLQRQVRDQGLWAAHLGPELGGGGFGQLKLALMNEILGRAVWAPTIFGCQAPDTGNAEILAHFGTAEQKAAYLRPLLDGQIISCYSMTEPQGGSDPKVFTTRAIRDGEDWVIDGTKFFSSNARWASFLIVMAVTDPDVDVYKGASMFIVPAGTPGVTIERNVGMVWEGINEGSHALVRYDHVRVPATAVLGGEGQAFAIAQTRLGGGRVHHAMRTVGQCQKALDMLCERALSRYTQGSLLADKQTIQNYVADSYAELMQFKLFVMYVAWRIDALKDYKAVRHDIAAVKVLMPQVLRNIVNRAIQVHGALGPTNELPLVRMLLQSVTLGLVDGPTEAHRVTIARQVLRGYEPAPDLWPTQWLPTRIAAAEQKFATDLAVS
jgi:acyl-CoA dehydrogenase